MAIFDMGNSLWILWLSIAIILVSIEFIAPGIVAVFFAIGGIFATITSLFTDSFMLQLLVFILASFSGIIFGKPFLEKIFKVNRERKPSTIDALKGQIGIVIETVSLAEKGLVKLNGELWTAKTNENKQFNIGEKVEIKGVDGVTLVIEEIERG